MRPHNYDLYQRKDSTMCPTQKVKGEKHHM